MNILIVTNLYPLPWESNRATFNKQQFDRLSEHHDVRIVVPVAWPDYFKHRSELKQSNTESLRYVCYWYTPKMLYAFFGLFMFYSIWLSSKAWIKKRPIDLVLGSWVHPDGFSAGRIAAKLSVPFVLKVHGSDINVLTDDEARKNVIVETCLSAKGVISVSEALREKLVSLGVPKQRVTRIYNGVDKSRFYPEASSQSDYFMFLGNLKRDKGVMDLIEAYADYRERGGLHRLVYVGDGPMKGQLKAKIQQYGLENYVDLLGAMPHEEAAKRLRSAKVLVLPSYHEGVPNVLLEAANCGVPVVSTSVGGIPEVVEQDKTGLLIAPGDIKALVEALSQVSSLTDTDIIVEHGARFTWENNIAQLNELLVSSIENRR